MSQVPISHPGWYGSADGVLFEPRDAQGQKAAASEAALKR